MKNILFFLLLFSLKGFGQYTQIVQGAASASSTALVTATTTSLQSVTRSGKTTSIVTDPISGGHFNYSSATLTDDYGTIFPASGGGHWVRDRSQSQGVNITWFGILPTNSADTNTARMRRMLDALPNAALVYIPNGDYHYKGIVITKPVNFKGESKYFSKLINDSVGGDAMRIVRVNGTERCYFQDFALWGNGTLNFGSDATSGNGIVIDGAGLLFFDRIWLRGHGGYAFYTDSLNFSNNNYISNSEIERNKKGISIVQNSVFQQMNAFFINNCHVSGIASNGVEIWGSNICITNNVIEGNRGYAITVDGSTRPYSSGARGIHITGNYWEVSDSGFIKIIARNSGGVTRLIDGIDIIGNFGAYTHDHPEVDCRNLAIVYIDAIGTVNPNALRVSGFTYLANGFLVGHNSASDSTNMTVIMNAHNVLTNESIIQASVSETADISDSSYINLGQATKINGTMKGDGHPNSRIYGFRGDIYSRKDSVSATSGYQLYVNKNRTYGSQYYEKQATGWVPLVDSIVLKNTIDVTSATTGAIPWFGSGGGSKFRWNAEVMKVDSATGNVSFGTSSTLFPFTVQANTSQTNSVQLISALKHRTSGTPAAGFGAASGVYLQSDGGLDRVATNTYTTWLDATEGSQRASWIDYLMTPAGAGRAAITRELQSDQLTVNVGIGRFGASPDSVVTLNGPTHIRGVLSSQNPSDSMLTISINGGVRMRSIPISAGTIDTTAFMHKLYTLTETITGLKSWSGNAIFNGSATFNSTIISTNLFPQSGAANIITANQDVANGIQLARAANSTYTSGTRLFVSVVDNFSPTSGTGVHTTLNIGTIINQSTATGITYGIRVNPTLTSAADWRSIQIDNSTGYGIYAPNAAKHYLNGITGIGAVPVTEKLEVTGNIKLMLTGKLKIETGTNASSGTTTLVAGTVTISTTAISTGDDVIVIVKTPAGTQGFLSVPTANITNGTSFVINSSSNTETSTVYWEIRGH